MEQYDNKEAGLILFCLCIGAILGAFCTYGFMSSIPAKNFDGDMVVENLEFFMYNVSKYPFFINKDMTLGTAIGYYTSYHYQSEGLLRDLAEDLCTKNITQITQNQKYYGYFTLK